MIAFTPAPLNQIEIPTNTALVVEAGALVSYRGIKCLKMERVVSPLFSCFTTESMYQLTYTATGAKPGSISIDGGQNLIQYNLQPKESLTLNGNAFVARDSWIDFSTKTSTVTCFSVGIFHQIVTNDSLKTG